VGAWGVARVQRGNAQGGQPTTNGQRVAVNNGGNVGQPTTSTKTPKKREGDFENTPPPLEKNLTFLSGASSSNRYIAQTVYTSDKKKKLSL
jgi:hypothetical protein